MTTTIAKIPTLQELIEQSEGAIKDNAFMVLLNQEPPKQWVEFHPFAKVKINGKDQPLPYLAASRVEYMLSRIYTKWWLEIKNVYCIANSCVVVVRLYVINPVNGETEWNDGIGATAIQTDKDKGAMDWNFAKSNGVQLAAPSAETYAFKDAAEKFGKLFGKDLSRKEQINYNDLLKNSETISFEDLSELFELKSQYLSAIDRSNGMRILDNKEIHSYAKLHNQLKAL